ncbi:MAG: PP2C family protein-serine/threonine phosphatase [bacterium]
MATKVGLEELARGIAERLAKVMQLKRVGVMFFRDDGTCCQEASGFDGRQWGSFCLRSGAALVAEMQKFKSESRFSTDYLSADLKAEFHKYGFRHIIPIRFKNRLVGTFIIGEKLSESPLHLEDLTFLGAVAKQASVSIENAFLYDELTEQERLKHELEIARRIQLASLPQETPQIAGLDIAGSSIPALEVGGDYYDYLNGVSQSITVIVGDVSGKGTSAALYMSKIQGILRSLHEFNLTPKELFVRANQLLCRDLEKKSFITAIGTFIDSSKRSLILARAGHLPLFYYHAKSSKVELITPKGLGLGLDRAEVFASELEEKTIAYQPGDVFLLVTDGITEARTAKGGEFGEEKLAGILASNFRAGADEIRDRVLSEVEQFAENTLPHDDQTIVVVKAV